MILIIAGSRECGKIGPNEWDYDFLVNGIDRAVTENGLEVTQVISGDARGPDKAGEDWAHEKDIPVVIMKPTWNLGRGAAFVNNTNMALKADALLVIYDGKSKGTKHMIQQMDKRNKPVYNGKRTY